MYGKDEEDLVCDKCGKASRKQLRHSIQYLQGVNTSVIVEQCRVCGYKKLVPCADATEEEAARVKGIPSAEEEEPRYLFYLQGCYKTNKSSIAEVFTEQLRLTKDQADAVGEALLRLNAQPSLPAMFLSLTVSSLALQPSELGDWLRVKEQGAPATDPVTGE